MLRRPPRSTRTDTLFPYTTLFRSRNRIPPATLFTFLDLSPRLIVGTHHSAIVGPYHRNGRAIADVMKAFGGTSDEAHAIVARHRAGYVLICPGVGEATIDARRAPRAEGRRVGNEVGSPCSSRW